MKPPSFIVREYLLSLSSPEISTPELGGEWPCFIGRMPDIKTDSKEAVAIYDIEGFTSGRLLRTGEVIEHDGVQIKVRGFKYESAHAKARALAAILDATMPTTVSYGTSPNVEKWKIWNLSRTTNVLPLASETGTARFWNFVFDCRTTIRDA